jgi:hypothetical protein
MSKTEDPKVSTQLLPDAGVPWTLEWPRVASASRFDAALPGRVARLADVALHGLTRGYDATTGSFAQTVRGLPGGLGVSVEAQGQSLRYTAMAALGLSRAPVEAQRAVLAGCTAEDVTFLAVESALDATDPGAVALAAWAAVEVAGDVPTDLLERLRWMLADGRALPTVDVSWLLTAAVGAAGLTGGDDQADLIEAAAGLLRRYHGRGGTYPHVLPPSTQSRWRAHVGSFADQVYPLQALARAGGLTGEAWMLDHANRTAAAICTAQGPAGQWWWHYDSRDGSVVERYPVYSVHQHAMAPMVLFDLWEAGGDDRRAEIAAGLTWIDDHPEVVEDLVTERHGLVWRKVGRREPRKAARALGAATTSLWQGGAVPGIDRVLPPVVVDHECRPYELGWLLYAWLATTCDRTENTDA